MGRFTILIALAISSAAFCSPVPDGEKLENSRDVERSVSIPILTLVEEMSSYSQSNPPESKTTFFLRAILPESSSHPRMQEYIRLGEDTSAKARKKYVCTRSESVVAAQAVLFECTLDKLSFRVPLSPQSSGNIEIGVDGGLQAIIADIVDSKFDRGVYEKETKEAHQGNFFGNFLELLVFPA